MFGLCFCSEGKIVRGIIVFGPKVYSPEKLGNKQSIFLLSTSPYRITLILNLYSPNLGRPGLSQTQRRFYGDAEQGPPCLQE